VACATACAGIVAGAIAFTGFSLKISGILIDASGGNLAVLLVLAAVVSLVLGLGLPTPAAYIMMAVTVAPAIVSLGVEPVAAHLFVMFFGVFAPITPPDMTAVFVAATLAKSDPLKTGWLATKLLAVPAFIPFLFIYRPALLGLGSWQDVLMDLTFALAGVLSLAGAAHGFMLKQSPWWERLLLFSVPVLVLLDGVVPNLLGLVICAAAGLRHLLGRRLPPSVQTAAAGE
jgi:TRAP-type uncharacterized transport system fused permease subunit